MIRGYQSSFAGGVVSPYYYGRTDHQKYSISLKSAVNCFVRPEGSISNRAGTEFICEVKESDSITNLIPFSYSTEQTYILEFGDYSMRVIKDGAQVLDSSTEVSIEGVTQANPAVITATGHPFTDGDEIYVSGALGMTDLNGRNFFVAGSIAGVSFSVKDMWGEYVDSSAYDAYTSGGIASKIYEIATPYPQSAVFSINEAQDYDVMYLTHRDYPVQKLSRTDHDAWTIADAVFGPSIGIPTGITATATTYTPGTATTYKYVVSATGSDGDEGYPSSEASCTNDLTVSGNKNTISWSALSGATLYTVYKYSSGVYGYLGSTESTSFVDENITADTSDTPQQESTVFQSAGDYPGVVTFFEQRLVFASTYNDPQACYMSKTANYENFSSSQSPKDSDAVTFDIRATQVNQIRGLVPSRNLVIFTSSSEFSIIGNTTQGYIGQDILRKVQSTYGSSSVPPIVAGGMILFAQANGGIIRDYSYDFGRDSYAGMDLTVLVKDLFQYNSIISWCYAQSPHSIVWVVRDDNSLLSLSYIKEHDLYGWTTHSLGGTDVAVECVTTIQENNEDAVYMIVRRTINGVTKRYIERKHTRQFDDVTECFFVDSGLSYSGDSIDTLGGLYHLEGETVVALADGGVIDNLVVTDGKVSFGDISVSTVAIGLPYSSYIETLPVDFGVYPNIGSTQGRNRSFGKVLTLVDEARGISVGSSLDNLVEVKQAATSWNPIPLYTGWLEQTPSPNNSKDGNVFVYQSYPLPMTICALAVDWTLSP